MVVPLFVSCLRASAIRQSDRIPSSLCPPFTPRSEGSLGNSDREFGDSSHRPVCNFSARGQQYTLRRSTPPVRSPCPKPSSFPPFALPSAVPTKAPFAPRGPTISPPSPLEKSS